MPDAIGASSPGARGDPGGEGSARRGGEPSGMTKRILTLLALALLPWSPVSNATPTIPATTAPLSAFLGSLHTHTGYSDGVPGSRPGQAYARSRDVEDLDFAAVTEHSEALDGPMTLSEQCLPAEGGTMVECAAADSPDRAANKWEAQRLQAVAESRPDDFTALRGFEWSGDVHGHMNVYFSRNYTAWIRDGGIATLAGFYQWLRTPALAGGGDDGLAVFNHPDEKSVCGQTNLDTVSPEACAADPARNWNDFAYVPELDGRITGIEMFNRSRNYEPWVVRALDKGWHLGVIGAEDIHEDDWGAARYAKTILLAENRTPAALRAAMAARRTIATLDPSIRIEMTAAGKPTGSRIASADPVTIQAHVTGGSVARVDLLTAGGAVAATAAGRDLTVTVPVTAAERWYMLRVVEPGGRRVAYASPVWIAPPPPPDVVDAFAPQWVSGDFHLHTTWSHDSYGGPGDDNSSLEEDGYTLGWTPGEQIAIAESRGLDFITITDHNDTRSVLDPGANSGRITIVPGYENSLAGHVQMIGATECLLPEGPAGRAQNCNSFAGRDDPARIKALANTLRSLGGAFQVNHPSDGDWLGRFGDGSAADPIVPDTVEVWNIGPWHYQHPAPASNDNDFSLRFWETYLNAGFHVAAAGGSDNHWRSTTAAQGAGQPTTWVWVTKPGVAGIIEGIRAGRTTVSHLPPAFHGTQLFLEADGDGDGGFESLPGDTIASDASVRIRTSNLMPGAEYHVVTNMGTTVIAASEVVTVTIPAGARWLRVELRRADAKAERAATCDPIAGSQTTVCRNRLVLEALTSAIYVTA